MDDKKYYWENDNAHSGYAYNSTEGWKGRQLNYLFDFIKNNDFTFKESKSSIKCLDIGCNAAQNLVRFDKEYYNQNNEYVGFDFNKTALDLAKENLKEKNATLINANLVTTDVLSKYDDNHFDFAFSTWALVHMPQTEQKIKLINDIVRVSKNGIFYEAFKNQDYSKGPIQRIDEHDNTNVVIYDDYRVYDSVIKLKKISDYDKHIDSGLFWWAKS